MTIPPADSSSPASASLLAPAPPLDGFAPEEFKMRREALRLLCPNGLILLRGTTDDEVAFSSAGAFRQNSSFFYMTGVDAPGALLILLPEGVSAAAGMRDMAPETREILFLPERDPMRETWMGAQLGPGEETQKATGIERVVGAGSFWAALTGWLRRCPVLYTVMPFGERAHHSRAYEMMQETLHRAPVAQFRDVGTAIDALRVVKSPAEIERIRQAIAITVEGQRAAQAVIARGAGRWEYEVEAAVFEAFRSRGATLAFPTIVGSGVQGTVLHYEENRCKMKQDEMVVVDIGARFGHYCGDITRAYPVGGEFLHRPRDIYSLVLDVHKRLVLSYKPGEDTLNSLKERCKEFFRASPLRARDTEGKEQTMDNFLPHGISHHLGLDVHDPGDPEPPLMPGNVITIEPGLYVPVEGIGVRLEDDYLVTPTGLERLGPPLEKNPDVVQAAMRPL